MRATTSYLAGDVDLLLPSLVIPVTYSKQLYCTANGNYKYTCIEKTSNSLSNLSEVKASQGNHYSLYLTAFF